MERNRNSCEMPNPPTLLEQVAGMEQAHTTCRIWCQDYHQESLQLCAKLREVVEAASNFVHPCYDSVPDSDCKHCQLKHALAPMPED